VKKGHRKEVIDIGIKCDQLFPIVHRVYSSLSQINFSSSVATHIGLYHYTPSMKI
jgi:hypothetical protein